MSIFFRAHYCIVRDSCGGMGVGELARELGLLSHKTTVERTAEDESF